MQAGGVFNRGSTLVLGFFGPEKFPGRSLILRMHLKGSPEGRLQQMIDVFSHQKGRNAGGLEQSFGKLGLDRALKAGDGDEVVGGKEFGIVFRMHAKAYFGSTLWRRKVIVPQKRRA